MTHNSHGEVVFDSLEEYKTELNKARIDGLKEALLLCKAQEEDYFTQMEGQHGVEFFQLDFAVGAMRHLAELIEKKTGHKT